MSRKRKMVNEADITPFHKRLFGLIGDETQAEFARRAGISQAGLHRILSGGEPTRDTLIALAKAGGVSVGWLAADEHPTAQPAEVLVRKLAFRASAGSGAYVIHEEPTPTPMPASLLKRLDLKPEHARAIEAYGNSMEPTIAEGDLVLIDTTDRELRDDRIFVFTIGDEAFLKRMQREHGRWIMLSDNPRHAPKPFPAGEVIRVIGRAVWSGRRL